MRAAVKKIEAAKAPILVIGAGANRKMTGRMLLQLVEKTGIPFVTTQLGKGVIDETHPRFVGCAALSAGDFVHRAIEAADLIVNVGHDVIEKPPFFMKNGGTEVIHISTRSAEVDPVYFPQVEVIGDIANAIWQIKNDIVPNADWRFGAMLAAHTRRRWTTPRASTAMPAFPDLPALSGPQSARGDAGGRDHLPRQWRLQDLVRAQLRRRGRQNTVLLDNALATMGAGLPSAMASAMVYPDRKVMAICGDGGFMMNSQEMETAVRLKLNLTVLILRDDSYGMIRWKQANMGFADWGLTYGNPDFVKYAEAYGAHGHRVDSAEGLPASARAVPVAPTAFT